MNSTLTMKCHAWNDKASFHPDDWGCLEAQLDVMDDTVHGGIKGMTYVIGETPKLIRMDPVEVPTTDILEWMTDELFNEDDEVDESITELKVDDTEAVDTTDDGADEASSHATDTLSYIKVNTK